MLSPSFGSLELRNARQIKDCENEWFWSVTLIVLKKESGLQGKFETPYCPGIEKIIF
jgi:hypothetical protein